ncbi:unnamed protein product [Acanthoscelides obtectus]|nr:unnamed protein product [Acanthoscelides obtectus]CAK1622604.1 ADP-ribosylation factor-like protein 6-interacting protein 1 [Acanthoscelides obtectus]
MSETESTDTRSRTFLDKFENNFAPDVNYAKFLNDPFSTTSIPSEYKISYAPTMESQIRRLRLSMETYREILVLTNGVLLWEKQWHPTAIIGGVTALFMLIWLSEPNILTIISLIGLIITVTDYILPAVVTAIFRTESWTNEKQRKYEEICTNIILYKTKFELLATSYYRMRITNPKLYFSITIFALSLLTWLGGTISNLFLVYLLVLTILLLPGMMTNGMLNRSSETLGKIFNDLVENAKSRVATTVKKIE